MRRSTENDPARLAHQCRDVGLFDPEHLPASVCVMPRSEAMIVPSLRDSRDTQFLPGIAMPGFLIPCLRHLLRDRRSPSAAGTACESPAR